MQWAHECMNQYDSLNKSGSGNRSGENSEAFFSKLRNLAAASEHMGASKNIEAISDAMFCCNSKAIEQTPQLLVRMSERAFESIVSCIDELDQLLSNSMFEEQKITPALIESWKLDIGILDRIAFRESGLKSRLFGAFAEIDALNGIVSSFEAGKIFNGTSASAELNKTRKRLKVLEKEVSFIQSEFGDESSITELERLEWRRNYRLHLQGKLSQQKTLIAILQDTFRRGSGVHHVYNRDKGRTRRQIERAKKLCQLHEEQINELSLCLPEDKSAGVDSLGHKELPETTKFEVVKLLHKALRCIEELCVHLPNEQLSFETSCEEDARRLNSEAVALEEKATNFCPESRFLLGKSTLLRELALKRHQLGRAMADSRLTCCPNVRPTSAGRILLLSFIDEETATKLSSEVFPEATHSISEIVTTNEINSEPRSESPVFVSKKQRAADDSGNYIHSVPTLGMQSLTPTPFSTDDIIRVRSAWEMDEDEVACTIHGAGASGSSINILGCEIYS